MQSVYRVQHRMRSLCMHTNDPTMSPLSACLADKMSPLMFSLQALLMRHEAYIAESEQERKAMTMQIDMLEKDKQVLERRNATVIEENRGLLDQLEAVNNAVSDSDAHVANLQATLLSTQQEIQKLAQLASRTESLEQQLAEFEREQAAWQNTVDVKEESEKSAVRRWQKAERTLASVQDQIERIEREAREEKERHVEVVGRMERRHAVERELTSAAGRLKGAAAAKTAGRDGNRTNVVSHFVKDILQDNANLQMGIVELREMLQNSNDEVEGLRKHVEEHQPAAEEDVSSQSTVPQQDLRQELHRATSSELHVHHHYHPPATPAKTPTVRRAKKKRYGSLTPGHFTPPSGRSTPRSSISYSTPTSLATILQQTSASVPQAVPVPKHSSTQSHQRHPSLLSSSGPASPQSTTNRTSSMFERVFSDSGLDSSRPTTPDSEGPSSPLFGPTHAKRPAGGSFRTYSAPMLQRTRKSSSPVANRTTLDSILDMSLERLPPPSLDATHRHAILEESETDWENADDSQAIGGESSVTSPMSEETNDAMHDTVVFEPKLRRVASHESLLSISGMDIHTLKPRPSQFLKPHATRAFSSQAVISDTYAQATRAAAMSRPVDSSHSLLSGMAAEHRAQAVKPSLGTRVGGWVFGRWGATPEPNTSHAPPSAAKKAKPPSISSASDKAVADVQAMLKKPTIRPSGINQAGPIRGFMPEVKQPHAPLMKSLDQEALKTALGAE